MSMWDASVFAPSCPQGMLYGGTWEGPSRDPKK